MISNTWLSIFASVLLCFTACKSSKNTYVSDIDNNYIYVNKEDKVLDQEIEEMIKPYRKELSVEMDVVLINNKNKLVKGRPNSTMGNWVSDILLDYAIAQKIDIDFAVQNQGGLRVPYIGTGDLTIRKIYELMPFDNMLVILETDGSVVQTFCDHITESEGWPLSRGIEFTMSNGKATNILVGNEPLDVNKKYRFAVPDYVANGGSDCSFFKDLPHENLGVFIRDLIIQDVKAKGERGEELNVKPEKRIHG